MVCTANELSEWKDFPKGLSVLLVDEDANSVAEIKSKLEAMDYVVSTFCNEDEALSAISQKPESFHVAIVEVNANNSSSRIKFLEAVKGLPTIMTSSDHCLSTMMQCIALGAVEFLRKPVSEDKLRNLWQHVVHKVFNGGGNVLLESLKPVKDSIASMLQLKAETEEYGDENLTLEMTHNTSINQVDGGDHSQANDKYPAPSTPQLNQGMRSLDDGDCQDQTKCSTEKESEEQEGETKSVDNTCAADEVVLEDDQPQSLMDIGVKKEDDFSDGVKIDDDSCPCEQDDLNHSNNGASNPSGDLNVHKSSGSRAQRKKMKVDWTPDLHKKFVQAVEELGVDQAIPSKILELMNVQGLTRHNVASHLQKYRMHRKNILPKQDEGRWPRQRSCYPHRPIMAYPPHYSANTYPHHGPVYPLWGGCGHPAVPQTWASPGYPPCTPPENWQWKPYSGMHADAWGCPVMPPPYGLSSALPPQMQQSASWFYGLPDKASSFSQDTVNLQPAEEVIDNVVKEAISKPWLPLPLGLKPPSIDTVLSELSKQGISAIPPHLHRHH